RQAREELGLAPVPANKVLDPQEVLAFLEFHKKLQGPDDPLRKKVVQGGGVQVYNRAIKRLQEQMNQSRPPQLGKVPESGRYNYEMFEWAYWTLKNELSQREKQYRLDRMARIAELLGLAQQIREDQWTREPGLEERLLSKARAKTFKKQGEYDAVCGRPVLNYLDLVDCKLAARKAVLEQTRIEVDAFQLKAERFKEGNTITDQAWAAFEAGDKKVRKYITLGFIEEQRWQADIQLERLDPSAPDHELVRKAIEESPLSEEEKKGYLRHMDDLVARIRRLRGSRGKGDGVLDRLEATLRKGEYVTAMEEIAGGLAQSQKELNEIRLDYALFATLPGMAKLMHEDNDWRSDAWRGFSRGLNWASKKAGLDAQGEYLASRDVLEREEAGKTAGFSPAFRQVMRLIAKGEWGQAREAFIASDPTAIQTHGRDCPLVATEMNDGMKLEAVLKKATDAVMKVQGQHLWVKMGANFLMWSAITGAAAPIAAPILGGVAKASLGLANAMGRGSALVKLAAIVPKFIGEVADHSAVRLHALSPVASKVRGDRALVRYIDATMKRSAVAGARMGAFTAMASSIGAGWQVLGYDGWVWKAKWLDGDGPSFAGKVKEDGLKAAFDGSAMRAASDGGNLPFATPWEAGWEATKQGAKWSLESWHPLLGMGFGVPSSVLEGARPLGVPLGSISENVASRGVLGLGLKFSETVGNKIGLRGFKPSTGLDNWMAEAMKGGGRKSGLITSVALADNVGKYILFSHGIGKAAHEWSWRTNSVDGQDLERRIKRAAQAELKAMEAPYWLALPVFPARYEVQGAMQQRQQQGYRELLKANELDLIANASEGHTLHLRGQQDVPAIQKVFQWNPWGDQGNFGSYTVTKDMRFDAIKELLPGEASGKSVRDPVTGKSLLDPFSVNPLEYFRIARREPVPDKLEKVGRLNFGDEVRDQAATMFEATIARDPKLAAKLLAKDSLGKKVDGFGFVRQEHADEVAHVIVVTARDYGLLGKKPIKVPDPIPSASKDAARLTRAQLKALERLLPEARKRMSVSLKGEQEGVQTAATFLEKVSANRTPSKPFKDLVQEMLDRAGEWAAKPGSMQWHDLVREFKGEGPQGARWKAALEKLSRAEQEVLSATFEFYGAIHRRFNSYNRVDIVHGRVAELLGARAQEEKALGNAGRARMIDRMIEKLNEWRAREADPKAEVSLPGDPGKAPDGREFKYKALREDLRELIKNERSLSQADAAELTALVKEMDAAPWLLHDSKGGELPGWRPQQFEALMHFLSQIQTGKTSDQFIRVFQMLGTGVGKTLLVNEGIIYVAYADALRSGKELVVLSVSETLIAQFNMEIRAMKKALIGITTDTWENFKTKIAMGKTRGRG
ncbi:MAG: hypothetical protein HY554_10455, partial [Elusimicrobia bacterium]|nr:hypothetical protein [Elusimicrobiota bacterium]